MADAENSINAEVTNNERFCKVKGLGATKNAPTATNARRELFLAKVGIDPLEAINSYLCPDDPDTKTYEEIKTVFGELYRTHLIPFDARIESGSASRHNDEAPTEFAKRLRDTRISDIRRRCNYGNMLYQRLRDYFVAEQIERAEHKIGPIAEGEAETVNKVGKAASKESGQHLRYIVQEATSRRLDFFQDSELSRVIDLRNECGNCLEKRHGAWEKCLARKNTCEEGKSYGHSRQRLYESEQRHVIVNRKPAMTEGRKKAHVITWSEGGKRGDS